jgi:hypothetical protein
MHARLKFGLVMTLLAATTFGCAGTIQSDKSIKEQRASSNQTGPVVVTAVVRINDGSPFGNAGLHLMAISRDNQGGMSQVDQLFSITSTTKSDGSLRFEVPREKITGVKEFSLALNPSGNFAMPAVIRRKDANEILSFKADEKTQAVELGEVVILLR